MAEMMVGIICVVPGACSAWRRELLDQIGGFRYDTLAEDADAAMTAQKLRYRVLHDNHAICDTEAPETLPALLKQRKRWMFGNYQVLWKNPVDVVPAPVRSARNDRDALWRWGSCS